MNKRKGISLIVLVITILVMIILSSVVIVSLSEDNPIQNAKNAKLITEVQQYKEELNRFLLKRGPNGERINRKNINAKTYDEIKNYIPSFNKDFEKYLVIKNGNLYFDYLETNKIGFSKKLLEAGIKPKLHDQKESFKNLELRDAVIGLEARGGEDLDPNKSYNYMFEKCKFYNTIFLPAEHLKEASVSINQDPRSVNDLVKGEMIFENCKFYGKFTLENHNYFYRAKFINCEFEDVQIKPLVRDNLENKKIEFVNCKINTKDRPTIFTAQNAYDKGNINLIFDKCTITNTGNNTNVDRYGTKQSLINIFAVPTIGQIVFIDSTTSMECPLVGGYSTIHNKDEINFNIRLKNSTVITPDTPKGDVPGITIIEE